jgi:hypothetical protein
MHPSFSSQALLRGSSTSVLAAPSTGISRPSTATSMAPVLLTNNSTSLSRQVTSSPLIPFVESTTSAVEKPLLKAPKYFLGKYAFRKLSQYGKLFQLDPVAIDEAFRNADYNTSCYIDMREVVRVVEGFVLKYYKKHKVDSTNLTNTTKNVFIYRMADVISVEERALISVFLRLLYDKDLIALAEKKKKKKPNRFQDAMNLYGEGRRSKSNAYFDSDEESDDDEEGFEEDEDDLFSDLSKLQNCDVGRLMRYLTKKKQDRLERERESIESPEQQLITIGLKEHSDEQQISLPAIEDLHVSLADDTTDHDNKKNP